MSIDRLSLRLQSESLSVAVLSELIGREATRSTERGSPVSSRRSDGPTHSVSTALFEWPGEWESLDAFVDSLGEVLLRIGQAREHDDNFSADVVVAVTSRPLGYLVELGDAQLSALSSARCGIAIDSYSPSGIEEAESDG